MHLIFFFSPRGGQEEKTLPNWIVCLAFSQSTHCSGKILERKRVWQRDKKREESLNRQKTLKEGRRMEEGRGSGKVGRDSKDRVSEFILSLTNFQLLYKLRQPKDCVYQLYLNVASPDMNTGCFQVLLLNCNSFRKQPLSIPNK